MKHYRVLTTSLTIALLSLSLLLNVLRTDAETIPRNETLFVSVNLGGLQGINNPLSPAGHMWGTGLIYPSLYLMSTPSPVGNYIMPYVGESYRIVNATSIEAKIRPEAKWWDGNPITADDLKFTIDVFKNYSTRYTSGFWYYLTDVKVIDARTIRFISDEAHLNIGMLARPLTLPILPKHRWEPLIAQLGPGVATFADEDPTQIVGAGPYNLLWIDRSADLAIFIRVDDWWGKDIFGLPGPKYVAQKAFLSNEAAALAFEAGEVDVCTHFFPAVWEFWTVKGLDRHTYYPDSPYFPPASSVSLMPNYQSWPLNDSNVRRAIAYAVPYQNIKEDAFYNYSARSHPTLINDVGPGSEYINQTIVNQYWYEEDINKAKQILDDAGITDTNSDGFREMPNGTKLGPWKVIAPAGMADWDAAADMIAQNLNDIGIDCVSQYPDFTVWYGQLVMGSFDMSLMWGAGVIGDPWSNFRTFLDPRITAPVGSPAPQGNYERYMNWSATPLIDAASKTANVATKKGYYSQLQEMVMRDLPVIPIVNIPVWYEYSEDYWVGWSNSQNNWWFSSFWDTAGVCFGLPNFFQLVPKGQTVTYPSWLMNLTTYDALMGRLTFAEELSKADINADGTINILDLSAIAKAFGSEPGDPRWNEKADVNKDGAVNILDISGAARMFGKSI